MVSIRPEYKHKEANIAFVFVGFIEFEVKKMVAINFDVAIRQHST
jgi:hypothetical protein